MLIIVTPLYHISQETKKLPQSFDWVNFVAERIGLEPMDRKTRSQISNLLHYHSANAPLCAWLLYRITKTNASCKINFL